MKKLHKNCGWGVILYHGFWSGGAASPDILESGYATVSVGFCDVGCSCVVSVVAVDVRSSTTSWWSRPTTWSITTTVSRASSAVTASRRASTSPSPTTATSTVPRTSSSASSPPPPPTRPLCRCAVLRGRTEPTRSERSGLRCRGSSWKQPFVLLPTLSRR